ncbi:abc-2 type transporter [Lucifera butyrica]|uniref:Abc-2 type transporter n=1 Tax=Lucifera butyrica TaxID=1351585 RepID=A0A498R7K2_9FIRM|nr:ABC transporter permease [Lucifera butyrica]VBB05108.1 abc-2 type transporter [Lucifera butyrica]
MRIIKTMLNETYKGLLIAWNYKFETFLQLIMMGIVFTGIGFITGGGRISSGQMTFTLIGYSLWLYSSIIIAGMCRDLLGEAQAGTLEQIFMSPVPVALILIGRSFATLITATVNILLFTLAVLWGFQIHISWQWQSLVIFMITLAGLFGFGFLIAGAALVFKRIGELAGLTANALLFLNGSMLPVEKFPPWLAVVAKSLPTTQGVILLRETLLKLQPMDRLWQDGSLSFLCSQSVFYFGGGLLFFMWCVRRAKMAGTLGYY